MIINQKHLLFSGKLPFYKEYILKISQQSTLNMSKLSFAENFLGYEIWVYTPTVKVY